MRTIKAAPEPSQFPHRPHDRIASQTDRADGRHLRGMPGKHVQYSYPVSDWFAVVADCEGPCPMKQSSLSVYLDIIQELLTCPSGEEWIRLKHHEDQVNPELVQVMEQVASQLIREGNRDTAIFLHNWAAKLHHIVVKGTTPQAPGSDQSDDYLAIIEALLSCEEEEEASLLTAHQDLIGPGLIQKMNQVVQQLQQQGATQQARRLQGLADELSQVWIKTHAFQPALQKTKAHVPTPAVTQLSATTPVADPSDRPVETAQPQQPAGFISAEMPMTSALQLKINQQFADAISGIARSLHQLNQTLTTQIIDRPHTDNPLWYMDALERAATAQWLLTTEEIERLIGVKPKCHGKDKSYQRGIWMFTKVGKLGAQTAWQVTKAQLDRTQSSKNPLDCGVDDSVLGGEAFGDRPLDAKDVLNGISAGGSSAHLSETPEIADLWA